MIKVNITFLYGQEIKFYLETPGEVVNLTNCIRSEEMFLIPGKNKYINAKAINIIEWEEV